MRYLNISCMQCRRIPSYIIHYRARRTVILWTPLLICIKSLLFLAVQTKSGRRGRVKTIVFISIKGVLYILALIVHDDCYAKVLRPPAQLCWEEYSCRGQRFWLGNAVVDSCTTQPPWIYSTKVSYFHSLSSTISVAVDFQHFLHSYEKGFWKVEAAQIKPVFCRLLIVLRLTL